MALDVLAYVLEFVLGPIFLLLAIPELPTVLGEFGQVASTLSGGEVGVVVENFLDGQYDAAGQTLASLLGTVLWLAVLVGIFGQIGEFGELGEMGELFDIFG